MYVDFCWELDVESDPNKLKVDAIWAVDIGSEDDAPTVLRHIELFE